MNLAIKLYSDAASNPNGIPGAWPAEVVELGVDNTLPEGPWMLMTTEEYVQYLSENKSTYDSWYSSYRAGIDATVTASRAASDKIAYGIKCLAEFHRFAVTLTTPQILTALANVQSTLSMLQLGLLQQAAANLATLTGPLLDLPYDATDPSGPTVRQHFIAFILLGDPL